MHPLERLVVYSARNTVTGEAYVGQTRCGLRVRTNQHLAQARRGEKGMKFHDAIRRYGPEAFVFEALCHALDASHLDSLERLFVAELNTFNNGYNSTDGGQIASDQTRAQLSARLRGRKAPWVKKGWDTRRANGTDKMRQHVPSGANNPSAKSYLVKEPSGAVVKITGLKAFCREHGLTFKAMYDTMAGKQTHHKGYVLIRSVEYGLAA